MKNIFKPYLSELNNVTWPTRKHAVHSMILVLTIMFLTGIFLSFVDYGLKEAIFTLLNTFN